MGSLILLTILFVFSACDSDTAASSTTSTTEETTEMATTSSAPSLDATRQFFYAWLADCANDHTYYNEDKAKTKALHHLRGLARHRILNALQDQAISGPLGQDELVWGPAAAVSQELYSGTAIDYAYVIQNLLYCVKTKGTNHYSIGIAGTDMISPFDWLQEDVEASTVPDSIFGGRLSKGSDLGWSILRNLKDSIQNNTLLAFLEQEKQAHSDMTVSVSGHSLGGAMTQVLSGYLKNGLDDTSVSAWVYAGPTAGDSIFATELVTALGDDNYHAYNNALDVVPHIWQADKLNEVCSIYNTQSFCRWEIGENPIINAVTQYLKDKSAGGNYKMPKTSTMPVSFNVSLPQQSVASCADVFSGTLTAWNNATTNFKSNCQAILNLCGKQEAEYESLTIMMLLYMAEMGEQHTTAYTKYFFQNQDADFVKAVTKYTSDPTTNEDMAENAEEGMLILTKFLGNIVSYFESGKPINCSCN